MTHDSSIVTQLRAAAEALNAGDPEPIIALMDDDLDWRGVPRGYLWWKRTPS